VERPKILDRGIFQAELDTLREGTPRTQSMP